MAVKLKTAKLKRSRRSRFGSGVTGDGEDASQYGFARVVCYMFFLLAIGGGITYSYVWLQDPGFGTLNLQTSANSSETTGSLTPVPITSSTQPPTTLPPQSPPPTPAPAVGIQDCTADQMAKVRQQLPPETCVGQKYTQKCSFTQATTRGCVDPIHMRQFYAKKTMEQFNAVVTSCRIDLAAVQEILHVGSHNPKYHTVPPCDNEIIPSAPVNKAQLFCVESGASATDTVENWVTMLGAADEVKMSTARLARLGDLNESTLKTSLDTLDKLFAVSNDKLPTSEPIHVMKILPFDPQNDPMALSTLLGAMHMLHRVRYLEFGYHWIGEWGTPNALHDLVFTKLKNKGFACYWKGGEGNLWRITGCWQDSYGSGWWSNIVCVNTAHDDTKELAEEMEKAFAATLEKTHTFGQQ